ncbi:MAG: sigma-70 family RNA polymerase sigma factor [Deltaproteobacteria bacterium]
MTSVPALATAMAEGLDRDVLTAATRRGFVAALRILKNRDEAEEACQEAAARAWAARDRYDPSRPFYAWYHRILKNLCLDRLASRNNKPADPEAAEQLPSEATQESSMLAAEDERRVHAAIEALPEDLRAVIELRHFEDASYAEMADILEIPIGTVMSRLYRARKTLKEALS